MNQIRFDGKAIVITGAGRGIGRAHALTLASRGAAVVVNDLGGAMGGGGRDVNPARAVVEEIVAAGSTAVADTSDISTPDGGQAVVDRALEAFGRIDGIVNNAGIIRFTPFPEADLDELDAHLAVHVAGAFNVARAAWPSFVAQGSGRVVNTTSSALLGMDTLGSCGAAKGGVFALSRALAEAGREHGICVNTVSPLAASRMMQSRTAESAAGLAPEMVSAVVAYLLHEQCTDTAETYLTGGGRIVRPVVAEAGGFTQPGLTPEDVASHWQQTRDTTGLRVLGSTLAMADAFHEQLVQAGG